MVFACEVEAEVLPENGEAVGIDVGLLHFATLSTGETIENPRYFRKGEKKLEQLQQALSRKETRFPPPQESSATGGEGTPQDTQSTR